VIGVMVKSGSKYHFPFNYYNTNKIIYTIHSKTKRKEIKEISKK